MASPGCQGASRTMGGLFHGHALGNTPKAADLQQGQPDFIGPVQGKVWLYLSDVEPSVLAPADMTPSTSTDVDISITTIGPILEQVAHKYSPICHKCFQNILDKFN